LDRIYRLSSGSRHFASQVGGAPREGEKLLRDLGGVLGLRFGTVEQPFLTRPLGW
jgi:hypothetical protein